MMQFYSQSKKLYYTVLRVPRDEAYFVYFTFESNEGLCYYSTMDESLKGSYRDIEVRCPIEAKDNLLALIQRLQSEIRLDVIKIEEIIDS